ncbi:MAG: DUF484 family protein [Cocleimonas sp.]|nr:DUF484 family protein [Cocleimonas sp.]
MSSRLKQTENILADNTLNEVDITTYLQQHPNFFQRHTEFLEKQQITHQNIGSATSLIERQVAVLREKNTHLENQLDGLLRAARSNEQIMVRLQHLTLELLRAEDLETMVDVCQDVLRSDFNADYISIRLIKKQKKTPKGQENLHFINTSNASLKQFDNLFINGRPICGMLSNKQQKFLFSRQIDKVKSTALLPLQTTKKIGILALGSEDKERFHSGMGTVFISHLGDLISNAFSQYIK